MTRRRWWLPALLAVCFSMGMGHEGAAADPIPSADGLPTVLSFGSERCPLCIREAGVFETLRKRLGGRVHLRKVAVADHLELASDYRIILIPTLVFVDEAGTERLRKVGFVDERRLLGHLRRLGWLEK